MPQPDRYITYEIAREAALGLEDCQELVLFLLDKSALGTIQLFQQGAKLSVYDPSAGMTQLVFRVRDTKSTKSEQYEKGDDLSGAIVYRSYPRSHDLDRNQLTRAGNASWRVNENLGTGSQR